MVSRDYCANFRLLKIVRREDNKKNGGGEKRKEEAPGQADERSGVLASTF